MPAVSAVPAITAAAAAAINLLPDTVAGGKQQQQQQQAKISRQSCLAAINSCPAEMGVQR
jgi:hypothetical protein